MGDPRFTLTSAVHDLRTGRVVQSHPRRDWSVQALLALEHDRQSAQQIRHVMREARERNVIPRSWPPLGSLAARNWNRYHGEPSGGPTPAPEDPLGPARGISLGVALGVVFWALVGAWWVLR